MDWSGLAEKITINYRLYAAKITSLGMIVSCFYQILLSLNAIFFIYPYLDTHDQRNLIIQEGLVEKAIILYVTMIINGFYGVTLLFKPARQVKLIHVFAGMVIFIGSLFFVVDTPFTTTPIQKVISDTFNFGAK